MPNFYFTINIPFDPVLIKLGNFIFTWHGIFMSLGMLLAVFLCLRIKEKFHYNEDMVYNTALFAIPSGIIGARMLFVFEYWSFFSANPSKIIALQNGGISVWGGIIGGLLGGFLFALFRKYPLLKGLDLAAFGLLLGQAIGRIGDLINGEHLGSSTDMAWGVIYTDEDSPAFLHSPILKEIKQSVVFFFAPVTADSKSCQPAHEMGNKKIRNKKNFFSILIFLFTL